MIRIPALRHWAGDEVLDAGDRLDHATVAKGGVRLYRDLHRLMVMDDLIEARAHGCWRDDHAVRCPRENERQF
jgi:hypothetical protein